MPVVLEIYDKRRSGGFEEVGWGGVSFLSPLPPEDQGLVDAEIRLGQ